MKRSAVLTGLVSVVCVASFSGPADPARSAPKPKVWVSSITPSPAYASNHTLYSVWQSFDCETGCTNLTRSTDGGASWVDLPARRWSGTEVAASNAGGEDVLVSAADDGIQISRDRGLSFDAFESPTGQIDVRPLPGQGLAILISGEEGQHLLEAPEGSVRRVPGTTLKSAQLVFHPAWPRVPRGHPAAFASGSDPATGVPVLQPCDASFSCSGGTTIDTEPGVARLFVSPSFSRDHTMFAAHIRGGLFRSDDGGASFHRVAVTPSDPRRLISTVQAIAFTRDFHATGRRGSVYAGLLEVSGRPGGKGKSSGGVYRSEDGGVTWSKVGGAGDLDRGVTALAVADDRVLGAPLSAFDNPVAPILCSVGLGPWRSSCPPAGSSDGAPAPARGAGGSSSSSRASRESEARGRKGATEERGRHLRAADDTRAIDERDTSSSPTLLAILAGLAIFVVCVRFLARRRDRRAGP